MHLILYRPQRLLHPSSSLKRYLKSKHSNFDSLQIKTMMPKDVFLIFFSSALLQRSVWHRLLNKIERFPWFSKFKEQNWMAMRTWPLVKGAHHKGREANDHTENQSRKKEREQVPQSPLNTHVKRPKWPKSPTSFFLMVTRFSQYFTVGINLYRHVTLKALKSVH